MKWLFIFGSLLKPLLFEGNSSISPMEDIKAMIRENATKLVFLMATVISLAIVLAAGIIIVALELGMQIDQNGSVMLSSVLIAGLVLIGISVCAWAVVLSTVKSERIHLKNPPLKNIGTAHPLQDAVALLIADYVKAREDKRAAEYEYASRHPRSSRSENFYRQ